MKLLSAAVQKAQDSVLNVRRAHLDSSETAIQDTRPACGANLAKMKVCLMISDISSQM